MREKRFVAARRARWERLTALVDRAAARGAGALSAAELDELALGYRAAAGDLATAQTRGEDALVLEYLNRLVARAHAVVYAGTVRSGWARLGALIARGFPAEVRRSRVPIGLCALITVLCALTAYAAVSADPANVRALLPGFEPPAAGRSLHDSNFGFDRAYSAAAAALIVTNNVKVAALAFAGGMTGGVVTLWVIVNNGLMLGGYGASFARLGFGADFWATIAPHGVLELSAIQIAGGAGLVMAGGYLRPGRLRRRDALVRSARRAATLVCGVTLLLCAAGIIEGFVSPLRLGIPARAAVGLLSACALAAYLTLAGRERITADRAS